jgi:hypothetical protein
MDRAGENYGRGNIGHGDIELPFFANLDERMNAGPVSGRK